MKITGFGGMCPTSRQTKPPTATTGRVVMIPFADLDMCGNIPVYLTRPLRLDFIVNVIGIK